MNSIAQCRPVRAMLLDPDLPNKQALFEAVGRVLEDEHGTAAAQVVACLNAREKLGSTGLGQGVAIPHARVKDLPEAVAAFVRPKAPIDFDAPDGKPVAYFFVLLVPVQATEQHLQILADAAEMLADAKFRDRLDAAKNQDEAMQLFAARRGAAAARSAHA